MESIFDDRGFQPIYCFLGGDQLIQFFLCHLGDGAELPRIPSTASANEEVHSNPELHEWTGLGKTVIRD